MSISWTNHRPPSMTDIFHLDGDISLVGLDLNLEQYAKPLTLSPTPLLQKSGTLKLMGKNLNLNPNKSIFIYKLISEPKNGVSFYLPKVNFVCKITMCTQNLGQPPFKDSLNLFIFTIFSFKFQSMN